MGYFIMKTEPGPADFYVAWSTYTDSPVAYGTRAEIEETFIKHAIEDEKRRIAEAFEGIEESGTSVKHRYRGSDACTGAFDDEPLLVMTPFTDTPDFRGGYLKRSDLRRYVETRDDSLLIRIKDSDND